MDKSVKVILGIAIAILYPIMVWFAVYTFIPDTKSNPSSTPIAYPDQPICNKNDATNNSPIGSSRLSISQNCLRQWEAYDQKMAQYESEQIKYDKQLAVIGAQRHETEIKRAQLAMAFGLLGILAVLIAASIPTLAGGLASGSTVTMLPAIYLMLLGISNYSKSISSNRLSVALMLIGFVFMTAEIWYVDSHLWRTDGDNFTRQFVDDKEESNIAQPVTTQTGTKLSKESTQKEDNSKPIKNNQSKPP